MNNVFISIPMNGRSDSEVEKEIKEITDYIHKTYGEDVYVMDNLHISKAKMYLKNPRLYYLGHAIETMAKCDTVVFAKGFSDAKGCRIEEAVAIEYGLDRLYLNGDKPVLMING